MDHQSLDEPFNSLLTENPDISVKVESFVSGLKRGLIVSSYELTKETLKLIRLVVLKIRRKTPPELVLRIIRGMGIRLVRAKPLELVVGNCFRRVIFLVKEEYTRVVKEEQGLEDIRDNHLKREISRESSRNLISPLHRQVVDQLKSVLIEGISEILDEIDNLYAPIAEQALEHIHANEIILVYGGSKSVEKFLAEAKRKERSFQVIVAEAAPGYSGHSTAKKLSELNIPTTVVSDSGIFAIMARVNKVIIGTHAVMGNGGLIAESGMHMVALAAKHHAVPVICVTGLYKLCPLFAYNQYSFIDLKSPGNTLSYAKLGSALDRVQVISPSSDYVPPHLISLFVTNTGGHHPSYIYRLLSEYYDTDADDELSID